MRAALIEGSLELAAERCGDLTPLVYGRLFCEQPAIAPLFCMDSNGQVRGEMLSQAIRTILDFVGPRTYAAPLIQSEAMNHEGYGVTPEVFGSFFGVLANTLRELLDEDWSPAVEEAWSTLLAELDYYVTHTNQFETSKAEASKPDAICVLGDPAPIQGGQA